MSKVSEAKEAQGYDPKPVTKVCGNCKHMKTELVLPAWMINYNEQAKAENRRIPYGPRDMRPSPPKCGIGTFAVKKLGTCNKHEVKS